MWIIVIFVLQVCVKADRCLLIQSLLDNILQIRECPSTDKQNISGIYRYHRNHGIFAVGSDRHLYLASLQKLQKSLLNRFTAYITLIGVLFLGQLVNLINKDNPMLCFLHIIICCSKKLGDHTLNIVTNIACLCKRSSICNSQRHVQKSGKSFYQVGLSTSGRSDHQHIGLLYLNLIHSVCSHTLIMIIDSNRHYFLGSLLTNYIFVKACLDLMWCRDLLKINLWPGIFFFLLYFLRTGNCILNTAQIDHTHIRHIKKIVQIQSVIHLLGHGVKAFLHTIITDMYIVRKLDHFACLALRTMTEKTEFLIIAVIFVIIVLLCYIAIDDFVFFIVKMFSHIIISFPAAVIRLTSSLSYLM